MGFEITLRGIVLGRLKELGWKFTRVTLLVAMDELQ